jgi:hypothetical protein
MKNKIRDKVYNIIFVVFVIVLLFFLFSKQTIETFINNSTPNGDNTTPDVKFPFKNIYDDKDRKLPIICIGAPFRNDSHKKQYEDYKTEGFQFLGCSSYQEFPGDIKNPHEDPYYKKNTDNYESMTNAWIHCFREPDKYLKPNIPKELISESDFVDPESLKPDPNIKKKYDFMYVCLDEGAKHEATNCKPGWQAHNRNWDLAKECLKVMCGDFKLKGLIMGRTNCDITEKCNKYISSMPFQPQSKFLKLIQECKWIFVPNVSDASPRVVTQAMCYNMPILMNKNIVGGWKYIDETQTGVFFTDEKDISSSLYKLQNNLTTYKPREWFIKHYGKVNSGKRLLAFLKEHFKSVDFLDANFVTFKRL